MKITSLESAWQNFANNSINSDFIKNILSATTGLIKFADSAGGLVPILTMLSGLILSLKWSKITKGFGDLKSSVGNLTGTLSTLIKISIETKTSIFQVGNELLTAKEKSALFAGGIGLVTTALSLAIAGISLYNSYLEEQRAIHADLATDTFEEIDELEELKKSYDELSGKVDISDEEKKKLSETIDTLNSKYGISKEKLEDESKAHDENVKSIEEEILKKKELAAFEGKQGVKSGKDGLITVDVESERQMLETMEDYKLALDGLNNSYDVTGKTYSEYANNLSKTILELDKKSNKTQQEKDDLKKLSDLYSKYSSTIERFKDAYKGTFELLQSGQKITNEDAKVLENLGMITEEQYKKVELLNEYEEIHNKTLWGTVTAQEEFSNITEDSANSLDNYISATGDLTAEQKELNKQLDDNKSKINNINKSLDDLQTAYKTLTTAVDEYNSDGYLSIDTLQSLLSMSDDYLSALSIENGQLVLNTSALDDKTNALIAQRISLLQTSAMNDLYNLSIGDTQALSSTAQKALGNLGTDVDNTKTKMENAIPTIDSFNQKLRETAASYGITSEEGQKQANAIIQEYDKTFKKITSLGAGTTRAGGNNHRYTGKPTGSKKSGGSKSTKEEYKATIDTLYKYKNALENAKESVDKLNDALKNTDNFNEQERYLKQLIDATNNQINKTNDLKNAQTNQINDYINQLRAQGFAINYNNQTNELYINNMQHLADFSGDTAKNLEKLIDKIQDLNSDNRKLDGSVRDLTADTKDYYDQLSDIPEQKLKKFNELMEDFQQNRLDQIQNQIDDIQHEMDNDERIKAIEKQIEALEKQNDELDNQKELEEKLLAVEEAKIKLQNAQKQKTLQVYRENEGFVWESDPTAIKEAADELKDAQDDLNDKIKQDQIKQLQAEKDALEKSYQDRIDALQNFLDEQNYQIDKANREGIKSFQDLQKEMAKYGLDSAEYLSKATDWLNNYNSALSNLNTTVGGILSSSSNATDGLIYSSATQDRINQALSGIIPQTTTTGLSLSNIDYDKLSGTTENQSIYINSIELPNVENIDDFIEELKNLPRLASSDSTSRS